MKQGQRGGQRRRAEEEGEEGRGGGGGEGRGGGGRGGGEGRGGGGRGGGERRRGERRRGEEEEEEGRGGGGGEGRGGGGRGGGERRRGGERGLARSIYLLCYESKVLERRGVACETIVNFIQNSRMSPLFISSCTLNSRARRTSKEEGWTVITPLFASTFIPPELGALLIALRLESAT